MAKKYGSWEVQRSLGEGGQAHTFLVTNSVDGRQGVLKRLKNAQSPQRLERFRQEAKAAQELKHASIPHMLDLHIETAEPFIVFEYREGQNLEEFLRDKHSLTEVMNVLLQVFDVIAYVHSSGVCHRDLKPNHIIVDSAGKASVIDFGLVYFENSERVTMVDEAVGSFLYMAPELEDGRGAVTSSCDVYSLGKIIYFALRGGWVFSREKHREPANDLVKVLGDSRYERVNNILDRMITADVGGRFASAAGILPAWREIMAYFDAVEWERLFTIKDGELRQHGNARREKAWRPSGKGWFTNAGHENDDWSIFGPYTVTPPLTVGLYEVTFALRSYAQQGSGNPVNGNAVADVAVSAGGAKGARVLAARRLGPMEMLVGPAVPDSWREHSLVFLYDGGSDLEFRVLRDWDQDGRRSGIGHGTYTLDFLHVRLRKVGESLSGQARLQQV